jgi:hypothetical protein
VRSDARGCSSQAREAEERREMSHWGRRFAEPIRLRDGRSIATLAQARDLILSLTDVQQQRSFWCYAVVLLLAAAESGEAADIQDAANQLLRALTVENMHDRTG